MPRLVTWLNDHLAVATGSAELARRTLRENKDQPWADRLEELAGVLDDDRAAIREILDAMGSGPSRVKETVGWLAEKVGRLKLNEPSLSYTPLARLEELETLMLSVASLAMMWRTIERTQDRVGSVDPASRAEALEPWLDVLRTLMADAAEEALAPA